MSFMTCTYFVLKVQVECVYISDFMSYNGFLVAQQHHGMIRIPSKIYYHKRVDDRRSLFKCRILAQGLFPFKRIYNKFRNTLSNILTVSRTILKYSVIYYIVSNFCSFTLIDSGITIPFSVLNTNNV